MEANELFIFKQSSLSLGTHGCNNLFIPSTGERPLLEERGGWWGEQQEWGQREKAERSFNIQQSLSGWVMNSLEPKSISVLIFLPVCSASSFGLVS